MFPKISNEKVQCLQNLVGIRSACSSDTEFPFYIEDIEGVDIPTLAKVAKLTNLSGEDFGNQLINSSARELLGDIELLLNNGFTMKTVAGDLCSQCTFLASYTANTGIIVKSNVVSRYQNLQITSLKILANVTATKTVRIDDGITPVDYEVDLVAGVVMPVLLDYKTDQTSVKIYFTDATVPLGLVSCATTGGCGCGGSSTSNSPITIKGLSAGVEVTAQYGFLPCASVTCSYDMLICNLVKLYPNILGLTLLYKIGEKYFLNKANSDRNNSTVSFNEEDKSELVRNYGALYASKLYGKNDRRAVKNVINDYLAKVRKDRCVICNSKIFTGSVAG